MAGEALDEALDEASSALGSTFSELTIHALTAACLPCWGGGGAGEVKDGCLPMGESGARPAAPIPPRPPDSGPVGVVGVARPLPEPTAHS